MQHVVLVAIFLPALWPSGRGFAQTIDRNAFGRTDSIALSLGPMHDSSLGGIVKALTRHATSEAMKLRAIYMWTAKNIALDCVHAKHPDKTNNTASYAFRNRAATSEGFAGLIGEMCRMCYLRCETVRGIAKRTPQDIGDVESENAAAWNVVELSGRRYVLDASAGAGSCDGRTFSPQLTDAWFLMQRRLFVLCRYPHDKRMQLLDTPLARPQFIYAPVVYAPASIIGIFPQAGQRGVIKVRAGDSVVLSFSLSANQQAIRASILTEDGRRSVSFSQQADLMTVNIPLAKPGTYPVYLQVETDRALKLGPAFGYTAQVSKRSGGR